MQIDFDDGVAVERCGSGHGSAGGMADLVALAGGTVATRFDVGRDEGFFDALGTD